MEYQTASRIVHAITKASFSSVIELKSSSMVLLYFSGRDVQSVLLMFVLSLAVPWIFLFFNTGVHIQQDHVDQQQDQDEGFAARLQLDTEEDTQNEQQPPDLPPQQRDHD
jgi:hypothetical protein